MIYFDVDVALAEVPVNLVPLTDDTDFKSIETGVAYNAAGMALTWHFVTSAGAYTATSVTPTTAGVHDWTHQSQGMYSLEIPASGGTINNDTEGYGWFTGFATGVLPWRGPTIGFRAAAINDALLNGGDLLGVNPTELGGSAQSLTDLKDFADAGYDPATNKVEGVKLVDTTTTNTDMVAAAPTAAANADAVWDEARSGHTTAGTFGEHTGDAAMRGTDSANTTTPPTAAAIRSEIDSNSTQLAAIVADTNELQTDDVPGLIAGLNDLDAAGIRSAVGMASANLDTQLSGKSTFNAASDRVLLDKADAMRIETAVNDASASTTSFVTDLTEATDDHYIGRSIIFTSGALDGQATTITDYNGTTKALTVTALTEAPVDNDTFEIV